MSMQCIPSPISTWPSEIRGPFNVILADTLCKRWQGLQWVKNLPQSTLMLFKTIPPGIYFHTRNCLFPIDIISLNSLGLVLKIWTVYPDQSQIGPMPLGTKYAIETNAGWAASNMIKIGYNLSFLL